ncbi:Spore photoproduct lyase [Geobacillus proteiniphilus]|uniref:Spore photoproduct lyase n=1 Tax=Geobacillus proteiniphilus TaxID=860353 RepID=A0A1Q5T367_9BACL|nr:Spore photoproduct lyase [Geobacillus proteiniphilus]
MKPFVPKLVYFEPEALSYPLGKVLLAFFHRLRCSILRNIPIMV